MSDTLFNTVALVWIVMALAVFPILLFVRAPYGRYASRKWGPAIDNRWGWILMELPAALSFAYFFVAGNQRKTFATILFLACWLFHYVYRSLIYPFRLRSSGKRMPVVVMGMAIVFNLGNGYLNGHYLGELGPVYTLSWLSDPRFIVGFVLFWAGLWINRQSDNILLNLRTSADAGYQIPYGGMYRYISCPNYFGELLEWTGFAVMTWSPAAAIFVLWTAANLAPRALSHHRWYREHFEAYPKERKALVPFIL